VIGCEIREIEWKREQKSDYDRPAATEDWAPSQILRPVQERKKCGHRQRILCLRSRRRWMAAEIPSGISLMMISAANKSATVPRKAPRKKPTGVFTRDKRRLLPTAPAMTLVAPPTTTVMKAGATNCWPMKG